MKDQKLQAQKDQIRRELINVTKIFYPVQMENVQKNSHANDIMNKRAP